MPRGGYRGTNAVKKSRRLLTIKGTLYRIDHEKLSDIAKSLKFPVMELIHRVINHNDFKAMLADIEGNVSENWHEQQISIDDLIKEE